MKKIFAILTSCLLLFSCGYQLTKATTTTTTTTTINYGQDCNPIVSKELLDLLAAVRVAWDNATDDNQPSSSEKDLHISTLTAFRSYVRKLELPTLSIEQTKLVDAIQNYLIAFNDFWESNSLAVNDLIIPYEDSRDDFTSAFYTTCVK